MYPRDFLLTIMGTLLCTPPLAHIPSLRQHSCEIVEVHAAYFITILLQVASDVQAIARGRQRAPYVIVLGDHAQPQQAFLIVDGNVVSDIPVEDVPIYLLAAFYAFNICYPGGCHNIYCFLEVILLKLEEPHIVVTSSVKNFLARLS